MCSPWSSGRGDVLSRPTDSFDEVERVVHFGVGKESPRRFGYRLTFEDEIPLPRQPLPVQEQKSVRSAVVIGERGRCPERYLHCADEHGTEIPYHLLFLPFQIPFKLTLFDRLPLIVFLFATGDGDLELQHPLFIIPPYRHDCQAFLLAFCE